MSNPNFDTLLSTTLDNYRETLTDNVFNSRPVLFHLMEKNRLRMLSGGNKIVEPLIYDEGQAGSYGEWEQLTITPQDGITAAEFDWKSLYATIAISGLEEAKNSGEEQVISLLEAKTMQAEQTLKNKISTMLFAESLAAATDWQGLGILIGDHNSTVTTVGGINCTTAGNEYWRSVVRDKTATAFADVDVRSFVAEAANSASDSGTDRIDAVFTAQAFDCVRVVRVAAHPAGALLGRQVRERWFPEPHGSGCPDVLGLRLPRWNHLRRELEVPGLCGPLGPLVQAVTVLGWPQRQHRFGSRQQRQRLDGGCAVQRDHRLRQHDRAEP